VKRVNEEEDIEGVFLMAINVSSRHWHFILKF
jgi:hypothetical protein